MPRLCISYCLSHILKTHCEPKPITARVVICVASKQNKEKLILFPDCSLSEFNQQFKYLSYKMSLRHEWLVKSLKLRSLVQSYQPSSKTTIFALSSYIGNRIESHFAEASRAHRVQEGVGVHFLIQSYLLSNFLIQKIPTVFFFKLVLIRDASVTLAEVVIQLYDNRHD
jgi:hypothetical protein